MNRAILLSIGILTAVATDSAWAGDFEKDNIATGSE